MKRILILSGLVLALAGCATAPKHAPIEIKVPVWQPCVVVEPVAPAWAVDALPVDAPIWDALTALRAEREQRKGYEIELLAALRACRSE